MMKSTTRMILIAISAIILVFPITIQAQWNGALHFSWWEHDRVIVPDTPLLWPGQLDAGTVEMWFKPDSVFRADTHEPDYTYLFCKNISGNYVGDMGLHWIRGQGDMVCFVQSGDAVNYPTQSLRTESNIWLPRWTHVAYVWDVADSMRLFINGVQELDMEPNSEGEICLPVSNGDQIITIGSGAQDHHFDRYETWRGQIDEVRISATARYTTNFVPADEPFEVDGYTVALWHFDDGEGLIATDEAGFGFNGILGGSDIAGYEGDVPAMPEWVIVQRDPKIMINEVLADPAADVANGDANGDGTADALQDEFIELLNLSSNPVDLTGWTAGDAGLQNFTFPDGYILNSFEFVTIFGGGDVSGFAGYNSDPMLTRVFTAGGSLGDGFDEAGDAAILLSPNGLDDAYVAWGTSAGTDPVVGETVWEFARSTAANGANDNSLTRSPDANYELDDPFVEHLTVSTSNYSPGMTLEGADRLAFTLTLLTTPAGSGTVELDSVSATQTEFGYGDFVTLTAIPAEGFIFSGWEGDEVAQINPVYIAMTKSKTITATFMTAFQLPPTIIINEINADPSTDPIYGDANRDWIRHAEQDEYIELLNVSSETVDMSGWMLGDDEQFSFTFPDGYTLGCGEFVTVFGGGDLSIGPADGWNVDPMLTHAFLSDSSHMNDIGNGLPNAGECVVLISPDTSYAMYVNYGSHYGRGAPQSASTQDIYFNMRVESAAHGGHNTSITRYPDGNTDIIDAFVEHLTISELENSPASSSDGDMNICDLLAVDLGGVQPNSFKLENCYPNPFNPSTTIRFDVPTHTYVSLTIYNIKGQVVAELANQRFKPGNYEVTWNGLTGSGAMAPSGMYLYSLNSIAFSETKKMILMK
ncbi:MAG: lamin tail domain-containing protein [Candidatus Marinimicrobia bacterium]|nr:lamin tail domain-containing protein [Candidatus Neomarinimicrobiota bacterium]